MKWWTRCHAADGCIHVAITADLVDPERINNVEVWCSAAALDEWRAQANPPNLEFEMRDLQMARYDAVDGGPLFP